MQPQSFVILAILQAIDDDIAVRLSREYIYPLDHGKGHSLDQLVHRESMSDTMLCPELIAD